NSLGAVTSAVAVVTIQPDPALPGWPALSFDPGEGADSVVRAVACLADGRILIGGAFRHVDGVQTEGIARLNKDGSVDPDFTVTMETPGFVDDGVAAILVQADGSILIGGSFSRVNGLERSGLARLHADGSLDTTFDPGLIAAGGPATVAALLGLPDGRFLVGGAFVRIGTAAHAGLARFDSGGTLDDRFAPALGSARVMAIAYQPGHGYIVASSGLFVVTEQGAAGGIGQADL